MCGACRRGCGRLATVRVEWNRIQRAGQGAQMPPWPRPLQLVQLPTQGRIVAEQLVLLVQQRRQALPKSGLKQSRQLLEQRFHGRDPASGLGQKLALPLQVRRWRVRIQG